MTLSDLHVLADAERVYLRAEANDLIVWLHRLRSERDMFPARVQRMLVRTIVRVLYVKVCGAEAVEAVEEKVAREAAK